MRVPMILLTKETPEQFSDNRSALQALVQSPTPSPSQSRSQKPKPKTKTTPNHALQNWLGYAWLVLVWLGLAGLAGLGLA